jgi:CheY-like chemotaxis protein
VTDDVASPVVLVADFDDASRRIAMGALQQGGYRVAEARTSAFALELMEIGAPVDLLVVDPAISGMRIDDIGREVRACRPDLRILYVTRSVDKLFEARGALWTGEAYLEKPFTTTGLLEAVSVLLYGRTNQRRTAAVRIASMWELGVASVWGWLRRRSEPEAGRQQALAKPSASRPRHLVLVSSRGH